MTGPWLKDRLALVATAVAVAAVFFVLSLYANGRAWLGPLMAAVMIVALAWENSRLRKLLQKNGIDPRSRRR
jgi:hypothetical protein